MENLDVREIVCIYGGVSKGNKRDKATGIVTAEEYYRVNILEVDTEINYVKNQEFYIDEFLYDEILDKKLELLKPCRVSLKVSATSYRPKLVGIKKLDEKINVQKV